MVYGVPILQSIPAFRYNAKYLEYKYYRGFQSSSILPSIRNTKKAWDSVNGESEISKVVNVLVVSLIYIGGAEVNKYI